MKNYELWFTGVRRDEAETRTFTELVQWDEKNGLVKVNPLAAWTFDELIDYAVEHCPLDPTFPGFIAWCRDEALDVTIVSDGLVDNAAARLVTKRGALVVSVVLDDAMQPGMISLPNGLGLDNQCADGSVRRTGVALRYMPGSSVFERHLDPVAGRSGVPTAFAQRPLWLLRGQDRTGRNDFSVGHRR